MGPVGRGAGMRAPFFLRWWKLAFLASLLCILGSPAQAVPSFLRRPKVDKHLVEQLEREVLALKEKNKAMAGNQGPVEAAPPAAYVELLQAYADTEIRVERDGQRTIVVFPVALLFGGEAPTLRQEALMPVDLLSTALKAHPELDVWLIGHTDDLAPAGRWAKTWPSNWERSFAWARGLQVALVDRFGVESQRILVAGRADGVPRAGNDTPEGRAQNRRIEVLLIPTRNTQPAEVRP